MKTLDVADYEICKLKLAKIGSSLNSLTSKESEIKSKIGILGNMNETESLPELTSRLGALAEDLQAIREKHSEINKVIVSMGDAWTKLKQEIGEMSLQIDKYDKQVYIYNF